MIILGLDVGRKRIGVAKSDELGLMAHGVKFILRKDNKSAIEEINSLVKEFKAEKIIVGLPKTLKDTESEYTREVQDFIQKLKEASMVEIESWDERFSSKEAERSLIFTGTSRQARKEY